MRGSAVLCRVEQCGLVCLGCRGGGTAGTTSGVWLDAGSPAPLFPDAVTLKRGVSARQLVELLTGRKGCSVKDSYVDVDLGPHGFRELVTAEWIGQSTPPEAPCSAGWLPLSKRAELESWCASAGLPAVLPASLLQDPSVRVLAAYRQGHLAAGAVANSSDTVVGISNVFQLGGDSRWVWDEVGAVVARFFPGKPVVGYEHGPDLDAALAAGFSGLGQCGYGFASRLRERLRPLLACLLSASRTRCGTWRGPHAGSHRPRQMGFGLSGRDGIFAVPDHSSSRVSDISDSGELPSSRSGSPASTSWLADWALRLVAWGELGAGRLAEAIPSGRLGRYLGRQQPVDGGACGIGLRREAGGAGGLHCHPGDNVVGEVDETGSSGYRSWARAKSRSRRSRRRRGRRFCLLPTGSPGRLTGP